MEGNLVAGRTCGSCNVCCVSLTIKDPQLQKAQGIRCRNARPDNSCAIYDTRPETCRSFFCGWRQLKWVREALRPDLSGVLVRIIRAHGDQGRPEQPGVEFMLLNRGALDAEGLAESVAAAVAAGVPTFLAIPGPPGYTSAQAQVNDALGEAVYAKNKAMVLDVLRQAWKLGRGGKRARIRMDRQGAAQPVR